jgi:hypothetical protein
MITGSIASIGGFLLILRDSIGIFSITCPKKALPERPRARASLALFSPSTSQTVMNYEDKIVDRQVGRNGDLFAVSIGEMETREERYPYLRILVSIVEQAHPEWNQAPTKDQQISMLIFRMSRGSIDREEVSEIVQLRDAERGFSNDRKGD